MVRSRNWPDLWSQISKIRDIQVVGICDLMKHWRFETNRISSVATAQPQSQKPVFDFDLTFGDLGLKFWHKVCNSILSRYWKNGGATRRRFSAIREKPEGRAFFALPPPVRVLNHACAVTDVSDAVVSDDPTEITDEHRANFGEITGVRGEVPLVSTAAERSRLLAVATADNGSGHWRSVAIAKGVGSSTAYQGRRIRGGRRGSRPS